MDEAVQPAPAGKGLHYGRRRPEETTLYRLVQEHLETFLAQVELETGAGLPDFVKDEQRPCCFDACGILLQEARVLPCLRRGGTLQIIATIEDPTVIVKILMHLGLLIRAPPRATFAAIRSTPNDLIPNRSPIQPGSAPEPTIPLGLHPPKMPKCEDQVEPSAGFPTHSHRNMEIITYVADSRPRWCRGPLMILLGVRRGDERPARYSGKTNAIIHWDSIR